MNKITYKKEVQRKLIHLSSLWMPVVIWFLPHGQSVVLFTILLPISFCIELLRSYPSKLSKKFNHLFSGLLREHENNGKSIKITGATYVFVAALFCVIFFSKEIAIISLSIMLVSDTAAALIGRKYGRTQIGDGKTLEGCIAFIVAGIAVVCIIDIITGQGGAFYFSGCLAVFAALLAELFSRKLLIDDNLSIPLVAGIIMSLL